MLASMNMCEMLSGIYELDVTAIVIMNMQHRVFRIYSEWKILLEFEMNTCQIVYSNILGGDAGTINNT